MLHSMLNFPRSGVFVIYSPVLKTAYVNYSRNIVSYVSKIVTQVQDETFQYKDMQRDFGQLQLEVLMESDDLETLQLHVPVFMDKWKEKGYRIYNGGQKKPLEYHARVVIADDYKSAQVWLYNKRRTGRKYVAAFHTVEEAEEFKATHYNPTTNPYCLPVYGENPLTKELKPVEDTGIVGWRY